MATQTEAPAVVEAIVVCGTCDSVFRMHEGRGTCPCCGGGPTLMLVSLGEQPAPEETPSLGLDGAGAADRDPNPAPPAPAPDEPGPRAPPGTLPPEGSGSSEQAEEPSPADAVEDPTLS